MSWQCDYLLELIRSWADDTTPAALLREVILEDIREHYDAAAYQDLGVKISAAVAIARGRAQAARCRQEMER